MPDEVCRINALWNGIGVSLNCMLALALLVFAAHARTVEEASLSQVALLMGTVFAFAVLMSVVALAKIRMEHVLMMNAPSKQR